MTVESLVILAVVYAVSTLVTTVVVVAMIVRLPETYLCESPEVHAPAGGRQRLTSALGNVAGAVLLLVGAALSLPGIPGEGLLTMLAGLFLMDFKAKRTIERRLLGRTMVLSQINRLRAWFGRAPLAPPTPA